MAKISNPAKASISDETNICIGFTEYTSIAKGVEACDAMIKAAEIEVLFSKPVCAGKYITLISGFVGAVKPSVQAALDIAKGSCIDHIIIPNIHPRVFPALTGTTQITNWDAIGVVETFTMSSCLRASDLAVKSGEVELIEIRLGVGLGGKAYFTLTGEVSAVESAVKEGAEYAKELGTLVSTVIIPRPTEEMRRFIL